MTQAFNLSQFANNVNSAGVAQTGGGGTGTNIASNDLTVNGLTVGKGGSSSTNNTLVGQNALTTNSTGSANCAFGQYALYTANADANSAFGQASLYLNTSGANNSAFGYQALRNNTTASNNTAIGYQAGYSNTTGAGISAFGWQTLYANTTGGNNAAYGNQALTTNTTGNNNAAFGFQGLASNSTGSYNTSVGMQALLNNTTASNNTAVGYQAGYNITTGGVNICIGIQSGATGSNVLTTGNNNIFLGNQIAPSSSSVGQALVIACTGSVSDKGSNTGFITPNGGGVYQGNNSSSWSTTSDQRLKKNIVDNTVGLSAISQIQVRNFEYRLAEEVTDLPKEQAIGIAGVQLGAIAQELQAVLPDCVKTESTGVMSVDTTNLTWYLINAVKELNAKITALENK